MFSRAVTGFARGFAKKAGNSSTGVKAQTVELPLQLYGLPARYANALYVAATKAGALDTASKELDTVIELSKVSGPFGTFVGDPTIARAQKVAGMGEVMKAGKFSPTVAQFFSVVAENGRLSLTPKIAAEFQKLVAASKGEVEAVVTSVLPVEAEDLNEVKEALKGMLKPGEKLTLKQKIDPSIMGGMVIEVGDKYIDLSIATKIRRLEAVLSEPL